MPAAYWSGRFTPHDLQEPTVHDPDPNPLDDVTVVGTYIEEDQDASPEGATEVTS